MRCEASLGRSLSRPDATRAPLRTSRFARNRQARRSQTWRRTSPRARRQHSIVQPVRHVRSSRLEPGRSGKRRNVFNRICWNRHGLPLARSVGSTPPDRCKQSSTSAARGRSSSMVASSPTRSPTLSPVFFRPAQPGIRSSRREGEEAYTWERREQMENGHRFCTDIASVSGPMSVYPDHREEFQPESTTASGGCCPTRLPLTGTVRVAQAARLLA